MLLRFYALHAAVVASPIADLVVVGVVVRGDVYPVKHSVGHALQLDHILDEAVLPVATIPVVVGNRVIKPNNEE